MNKVQLLADKFLNGEFYGDLKKDFPSHEDAMSWVRNQNIGHSEVYTIENVRIYPMAENCAYG